MQNRTKHKRINPLKRHNLTTCQMLKLNPVKTYKNLPRVEIDCPKSNLFDVMDSLRPATISCLNTEKSSDVRVLKPVKFTSKRDFDKPHQLLRENTYDVINPSFHKKESEKCDCKMNSKGNVTSRSRLSKDGSIKMSSVPETGRLLALRQRDKTASIKGVQHEKQTQQKIYKSNPREKLKQLSEIFENLEMKGRHRDKMKQDNWF